MTDSQKAYWAGFFDGEGCVSIYERRREPGRFSYRVQLTQKKPEPIDELIALFGGRRLKMTNGCWSWVLTGPQSERVMISLLPWLKQKATQARQFVLARSWLRVSRPDRRLRKPLFTRALRTIVHLMKQEKHR